MGALHSSFFGVCFFVRFCNDDFKHLKPALYERQRHLYVGLFANLGVFYAIGSTSAEITSAGETVSDDLSTSGFIVQPKLGVAFTL
jgi:hypothetical protein